MRDRFSRTRLRRALAAYRSADSSSERGANPPLPSDLVKTSCGRVIFVNPKDIRGRKLIATSGNVNPPSLAAWQALVAERDWDLVVDIGANYGEMLLNLEPHPPGLMVAVEANCRVAAYLSASMAANSMRCSVLVGALGSDWGIVRLDGTEGNSGLVSTDLLAEGAGNMTSASLTCSTTLDYLVRVVASKPLHELTICVKMDVEGNERSVLDGATETLSLAADAAVMLEVLHADISIPGYRRSAEIPSHSRPDLVQDVVFRRDGQENEAPAEWQADTR